MNHTGSTRDALLVAASGLFAEHGYDGTSVRAITQRAQTNLGAVTYHFGSKDALYEAVAAALAGPFRERITETAAGSGPPLARLEALVRTMFDYLSEHPDVPRFMVQLLAGSRPPPRALQEVLRANHAVISQLIIEGQKNASVRGGDPRLMALSLVAQPIWMSVVRRLLRQTIGIDQEDAATRAELIDTAVRFVRAGLASQPGQTG
jgi:AcrR family transcriptional regulator